MIRHTLLLAALLLLPFAADAAGWKKSCSSANVVTALNIGEYACNDPDGDTPMLNIGRCENFSVFYWTDLNVDGTASTNTVQIRACPGTTTSVTACWPIQNVTLTGTTPAEAIYGADLVNIFGDFNAAINNDPRLIVKCNGPH